MQKFEPIIECFKAMLPSRMKGKTIMWWMSFNVVALWWYATLFDKPLDGSIAAIYIAALGTFAGSKGFEYYQERKSTAGPPIVPGSPAFRSPAGAPGPTAGPSVVPGSPAPGGVS